MKSKVIELQKAGLPLRPVSVDDGGSLIRLLDRPQPVDLTDPSLPDRWVNFYREDDWSSTAYFYLDRPVTDLPPLAPLAERTADLIERT